MEPIIKLQNVSVCYEHGKSNETQALKDVNLEIFPGEYIVFFGPSGCGKSTLLYTIAGLESATEGEVIVKGENLRDMSDRARISFYRDTIGMVFQAFYLVSHLSAKDNMMLSKMFSGVPVEEREARAQELMDKFNITPYADHKPSMLSGGQQQRTAIGRALMNDPEIILADEPVGNLDSKNAEIVLQLLAQINREEKKTVIQVTHNPKDVHFADRVFYMKDGVVERVVVNAQSDRVTAFSPAGGRTELEKLHDANPDLNDVQLHSRFIMRSLLLPYDLETEQRIETIIGRYIKDEITSGELTRLLDNAETGAGLYAQKAKRISKDIEEAVRESRSVLKAKKETDGKNKEPYLSPAMLIRRHLLDDYTGTFTPEQVRLLDEVIEYRIEGRIQSDELYDFLNTPRREGGLGLNRGTAKRFSKRIELACTT